MISSQHPLAELPPVEVRLTTPAANGTMPRKASDQYASFTATNFNRWRDLKARDRIQWRERRAAKDDAMQAWTSLIQQAAKLDDIQKVNWINARINAITYVSDKTNWGMADYWATPLEFIERGGDCEDFAIAKYSLLRESGFPVERMKIAVTKNHAVLLVQFGEFWVVLDNNKKKPYMLKSSLFRKISYTINDIEWELAI